MFITNDVKYIGVNDHEIDLFEGQYVVENGMAYNSYVILDEKIAVFDTVDIHFTSEWLANLEAALDGRTPDYLIVQHMEPDHSASIAVFMEKYPAATVVASDRAFTMIHQFFGVDYADRRMVIQEGDTLNLGTHTLTFVAAPMVHWPEVMVTYDSHDKILFSADGFGKFGALDVEEEWACEARRYYIGIVGKYGAQVQALLKKAAGLDIQMICPLHGPVLKENLGYYLGLYDTWSSYGVETEGIMIAYTSVYGHTKAAVEKLADLLRTKGQNVIVNDLARCDMAEAVEDAFRYGKIVLATTTYNGDIFPFMKEFIHHLTERNFQNRFVGFIENGSWAPTAGRVMKKMLEGSKNLTLAGTTVTIKSALNAESTAQLEALAEELISGADADAESAADAAPAGDAAKDSEAAPAKGKYVCKVCGFEYDGDTLPEGYTCPLCKKGPDAFEYIPAEPKAPKADGPRTYVCKICGYEFVGDSVPEDFVCPLCKRIGSGIFELVE